MHAARLVAADDGHHQLRARRSVPAIIMCEPNRSDCASRSSSMRSGLRVRIDVGAEALVAERLGRDVSRMPCS